MQNIRGYDQIRSIRKVECSIYLCRVSSEQDQVEQYKTRYGYDPESVLADGIYGSRDNRSYLKGEDIRFGGRPLGRPMKQTELNAEQIKLAKKRRRKDPWNEFPLMESLARAKMAIGSAVSMPRRQRPGMPGSGPSSW
jgi:hypothetical protein